MNGAPAHGGYPGVVRVKQLRCCRLCKLPLYRPHDPHCPLSGRITLDQTYVPPPRRASDNYRPKGFR